MTFWLTILGLPAAIYLWLALAPRGRTALYSCLVLAALIGLGWLAYFFDIGGLTGRDGQNGAVMIVGLTGATMALGLGASLQVLRLRLPRHWPSWAWPLCVAVVLIAAAFPLFRILTG